VISDIVSLQEYVLVLSSRWLTYLFERVVANMVVLLAPHGELRGEQYAIQALHVSNRFIRLAWLVPFSEVSSLTMFHGDGKNIPHGHL
jgi:hypothetical protein